MESTKYKIVKEFISACNKLNIETMIKYIHPEIEFINIADGEENAHAKGVDEFKEMAKISLGIFEERKQKILSYEENEDKINVVIKFRGKLSVDLPNVLEAGDILEMKGESIFTFENNLIISLIDKS